ncbi:hypothetical protein [Paenibacillus sp. 7516]|uniref:hypothetical protein n=1 Tax=Paenibacillus sp. 7516 TaxID=2022549 RepID=UPI001483CE2A|nr:hypothetical protein [Paenibacillus sp. 7516]
MIARKLVECTIDLNDPVGEIGAAINVVIGAFRKDQQIEILKAVQKNIEVALQDDGKE